MVQIGVIQQDHEWKIYRDGMVIGWGVTRSAAIELAEALAFRAAEEGQQVELLTQGLTGEMTSRSRGLTDED